MKWILQNWISVAAQATALQNLYYCIQTSYPAAEHIFLFFVSLSEQYSTEQAGLHMSWSAIGLGETTDSVVVTGRVGAVVVTEVGTIIVSV